MLEEIAGSCHKNNRPNDKKIYWTIEFMRIGRTIPPAAAPIYVRDIISGLTGLIRGQNELNRFKSELKDYFSAKHCFLLSSGKAALTIILQALHDANPDKEEVLIPAFICYSVPSAIVRAGLKVKLCDSDPETLDFNFDQLEKIISHSKLAIQNSKFLFFVKPAPPFSYQG